MNTPYYEYFIALKMVYLHYNNLLYKLGDAVTISVVFVIVFFIKFIVFSYL